MKNEQRIVPGLEKSLFEILPLIMAGYSVYGFGMRVMAVGVLVKL